MSVLLASEDSGVVCLEKDTSTVVIETGAQVQQISALEAFGLFLLRYDTGIFYHYQCKIKAKLRFRQRQWRCSVPSHRSSCCHDRTTCDY
jgi:hypothetical protein